MKIKAITSQIRNDLYGVLVCEHCGEEEKLIGGYDDDFWHNQVLPKRYCQHCEKNRAGDLRPKPTNMEKL